MAFCSLFPFPSPRFISFHIKSFWMHQAIMPYKKSCDNRLVDLRGSHVFLLKSSWYAIDMDLK